HLGQGFRLVKPACFLGGVGKRQQPVHNIGVVVEAGGEPCLRGLAGLGGVAAQQPSVGGPQLLQNQLGGADGDGDIFQLFQHLSSQGEAGDHLAVPTGEDLG